jgi:ubiquinone/menaquinone biosynthesis C-methylase UbiE
MGYGSATTMMGSRPVEQYATFIPYLKPGMTVLDCGCGPGTITIGLAELDQSINTPAWISAKIRSTALADRLSRRESET